MSETETEIETVTMVLTCATEDCGNQGEPIPLTVPVDCSAYICGACGNPIQEIRNA